jgi:hypothetical protein
VCLGSVEVLWADLTDLPRVRFRFSCIELGILTSQRAIGLVVGGVVGGVVPGVLLGFGGSPDGFVVGIGPETFPAVEFVDGFDDVLAGADGATLGGGGGFDVVLELSDVNG